MEGGLMGLSERQIVILLTVIQNYLETGEPVGSRTISKSSGLTLSPATIRNEMADLEELGYIMQPHTSAGRIPSDKGYRFYVNQLMESREQEVADMKSQMLQKADKMEQILKQAAQVLASSTNYATMVTAPNYNKNRLKFIQLSMVEKSQIIVVVVLEGNIIKNEIISIDEELSPETLLSLNMLLNTHLNGMSIQDINLGMVAIIKEKATPHREIVAKVLEVIGGVIRVDEDLEVYTSGASNVFKYPELRENESAQEILSAFEEKQQLAELVSQNLGTGDTGIQVYIGDETSVKSMKDCSLVTATYKLSEDMQGVIGIVGPKRMDYQHVMKTLKTLKDELDHIYNKK